MDCQKIVIDYLEGRIKPVEFEKMLDTEPEVVAWLRGLIPEGETVTYLNYIPETYKTVPVTVPLTLESYIRYVVGGATVKGTLDYHLNMHDGFCKLVKKALPELEFTPTTEPSRLFGLYLDTCPSYIGGSEVNELIENIVAGLPEELSKTKKIALGKQKIKETFHIEKKRPYWMQDPEWPMLNGKPMKFVKSVRLNPDQIDHYFVDPETGEERIVHDGT